MWVSSETYSTAILPPGKNPRTPLYRRLGGLQTGSWSFGKDKNILPLVGLKTIICHLVA